MLQYQVRVLVTLSDGYASDLDRFAINIIHDSVRQARSQVLSRISLINVNLLRVQKLDIICSYTASIIMYGVNSTNHSSQLNIYPLNPPKLHLSKAKVVVSLFI